MSATASSARSAARRAALPLRVVSRAAASTTHGHGTPRAAPPFYWQCRWYSRCDLADLRRAPSPLEYRTVRLGGARPQQQCTRRERGRRAAPAGDRDALRAEGRRQPRLGVLLRAVVRERGAAAGAAAGELDVGPARPQFRRVDGRSARRLSGCTRLRVVVVSEELRAAAAAFAARNARIDNRSGATKPAFFNPAKFHKWQVVAPPRDVVIFADADLELVPVADTIPALARERGAARPGAPRRPTIELVCNPDPRSPLNGRLMLLKPSAAVYAEGVRAADRTLRPGRRLGRRRSRRRGGASVPPRRLRPSARRPPSRAAGRAPPRLAASGLRRTATGAPTVLGHLRARGPATRGSVLRVLCATAARGVRRRREQIGRPAPALHAALVGWLQAVARVRERLQYRAAASGGSDGTKKNDGENSLHLAQFYDYVVREHAELGDAPSEAAARAAFVELQRLRRGVQPVPTNLRGLGAASVVGRLRAFSGPSGHPESYRRVQR